MMVPAVVVAFERPLAIRRSAKFAGKHNQRVFEQPALFQVRDQGGAGLIDIKTLAGQLLGKDGVVIQPR